MLQPHSLLWHYLWLAPNVLQAALAGLLWRRGLQRQFPVFFLYLIFGAIEQFTLYGMDVLPSVSEEAYWSTSWVGLTLEAILVVGVIGELFFRLLQGRPAIAKVGSRLISAAGAILVLLAVVAAAYAPVFHRQTAFTSRADALMFRAYVIMQSSYMIDCGLVLVMFLFAAHYRLSWKHRTFGIALGFGIVWCEHLAAWAMIASGSLLDKRLDFLNMATYHLCVLIWFYFLLVPQKVAATSAVSLPENNLDIWNRELERLLHQ
jgi:hypothetical protein